MSKYELILESFDVGVSSHVSEVKTIVFTILCVAYVCDDLEFDEWSLGWLLGVGRDRVSIENIEAHVDSRIEFCENQGSDIRNDLYAALAATRSALYLSHDKSLLQLHASWAYAYARKCRVVDIEAIGDVVNGFDYGQ
jgi:hypothetical protein